MRVKIDIAYYFILFLLILLHKRILVIDWLIILKKNLSDVAIFCISVKPKDTFLNNCYIWFYPNTLATVAE